MALTKGRNDLELQGRESKPIASIITVVYNSATGILETLQSVINNKPANLEYIVIDGGSTDGTIDIIRRYENLIDYWISEKDSGIYDAINKGIRVAQGSFFLVLNVGDTLLTFPSQELFDAILKGADVALFNVRHSDGRIISSRIDYRIRFGNTVHHQGAFYSRALNIQYDLRYKVFSDFDTNQLLFLSGKKFISYPKVITRHELDGISNDRKHREEYFEIIAKNFGVVWSWVGRIYIAQGELRRRIKNMIKSETTPS